MTNRSDLLTRIAGTRAAALLEPVYARLGGALEESGYAGVLRGEGWLGHGAHPMLTDVPIGLLTSANVLDLLGGSTSRRARTTLCALGVAAAGPTALTGLADWNRLEGEDRRLGAVHAVGNGVGVALYGASTWQRLRGRHGRATFTALAGGALMAAAGYLGGELAVNRGAAAHHPATRAAAPSGAPVEGAHAAR